MAGAEEVLPIVEALAFAGLDRDDFNSAVRRGLYPVAPKTSATKSRIFNTDDLIAAFCLGQLRSLEVAPRFAGRIASDIHRQIRKDHGIQSLSAWKVTPRNGKPRVVVAEKSPLPTAIELFVFRIADIRMRALEGIDRQRQLRERAKQTGT
jgi:hypothetical protein